MRLFTVESCISEKHIFFESKRFPTPGLLFEKVSTVNKKKNLFTCSFYSYFNNIKNNIASK